MSARAGVLRSLTIAGAAVWLSSAAPGLAAAAAPLVPPAGTVHTVDLPGGAEGIRRAIGDRTPAPTATLVVEMARRFHGGTSESAGVDPVLAQLRAWLRACARDRCAGPGLVADRVPLPGTPAFWRTVVFDRAVPESQVMLAILERREAAILYSALLSMREEVRAWLLARPGLMRELRSEAGPLLVAAPYLRISGDRWQWPGGEAAGPVWQALAGVTAEAPEAWLLAVLRGHGGALPYLLEVVDTLSPDQQRAVLALGDADPARRVAAGVELVDALRAVTHGWQVHDRPFWRPSCEPAFLLAQIATTRDGDRLALPGGRLFWTLTFGDGSLVPRDAAARAAWDDPTPVSAGWLVARLAMVAPADQPVRYEQVLFAARHLAAADPAQATAVATILRGYSRFPQLLRLLDRLDVGDVPRLAALVQRADALTASATDWRGHAALLRWQSALAFLDHMARLGALRADEQNRALDALAAPDAPAASRGTRVRTLVAALGSGAVAADRSSRPIEDALIARLTRSTLGGRRVTWEGERYRVDVGAAERDRIARVRGRDALPRLDGAWAAFALSDLPSPPDVAEAMAQLAAVAASVRLERTPATDDRLGLEARTALATARRLIDRGQVRRDWPEIRSALDDLGEALATEGFAELTYAIALGWAEDLPLSAVAAFRRHVFTRPSAVGTIDASWVMPEIVTARGEAWHVAGSLVGLGDTLAPVALRRPSLKPLGAAPALNTGDRRWLVSTIASFDRRRFTDDAQRTLVAAVARGRARVQAVHDAGAARALVEDAGAPPLRQTVAAWLAQENPTEFAGVVSMTELVRLGSPDGRLPEVLDGWGTSQRPVSGRMTAGAMPPWPWERYAGRSLRLVSCALPDLPLTLAMRLADLELPAILVVDLMPSATYELVNLAAPRHADDVEALAAYVRGVDRTAMERHLGLLTTAGPLRPDAGGSR